MPNRLKVRRAAIAPVALLTLLVMVGGTAPAAVNLPTASCFDLKSFDGVETRPTASYCRNATSAAGYGAMAYSNKSAKQALGRLPLDGVFSFAGHAIVAGQPMGAGALFFEYPAPGQSVDALAGWPAAMSLLEGPVTLCDESGTKCRTATLVTYPWANALAKYNLVVLEACNTAGSNLVFSTLSMANTAHFAGAGTVIGFKDLIGCPISQVYAYCIKWAGVFWGQLQNGVDYRTATVAASSAVNCCGFYSYTILQLPSAPTRLAPAKYYPAGGLHVGSIASDARTDALARWLGQPVAASRWLRSPDTSRNAFTTDIPGRGLFQIDARTNDVQLAVFSQALDSPGSARISSRAAQVTADRFARDHFPTFDRLSAREATYLDHGAFREYRFTWQGREGETWLPSRVSVGINAATGAVAYYDAKAESVEISAESAISRSSAIAFAVAATKFTGSTRLTGPTLEIVDSPDGRQHLVWISEIELIQKGVYIPRYDVVWTDALTGRSTIVARS